MKIKELYFLKTLKFSLCGITLFAFLGGILICTPTYADNITFNNLISGKSTFGFDSNNDGIADVIFSTPDPFGFNTLGPGANQNFIDEPGLEGSSLFNGDLRVDFVNGARNNISFGFAINAHMESSDFFARMSIYDEFDKKIGDISETGYFSSTPSGLSSYPEGVINFSFSEVASYAILDFESQYGRYIIDNFSGDFSSKNQEFSKYQLQASVIESGYRFIETSNDVEVKYNTYNAILNECTANNGKRNDGTPCDYDELVREKTEADIKLLKSANEAAYSSRDLVTQTSILPGPSVLEWLADAPSLIDEILGFLKVTFGSSEESEQKSEIKSVAIDGEIGEFTINPSFLRYDLDFTIDYFSDSAFDEFVGQQFLFDYSFNEAVTKIGLGFVKSVGINDFGGDQVTLNLIQLTTNDFIPPTLSSVSLPGTFSLFVVGIVGLVCVHRKSMRYSKGAVSIV